MAVAITLSSISKSSSLSWLPLKTMINVQNKKWVFNPLACCSTSSSNSRKQLILYSKPGCCLCDGLKEKLHAAFSLSSSDPSLSLQDVHLQIKDITTNAEWEKAYEFEIPVLARVSPDGTEEILPRLSPRLGVALIQKKVAAAFSD
ncbi:uncharacterized protein LOC141712645 [Apium graveolens]|uniref:uncharacterized protein LOC141712645 n=1 Tax=Apium graveolens TaxID=4045 RepID=UPI003D7B24A3